MKFRTWLSSVVTALAACGGGGASGPASPPAPTAAIVSPVAPAAPLATPTQQLDALYAEYWEDNLKLNPLQATEIGDPRYNDQLPNSLSAEYRERERAFRRRYLARAEAIGSERLSGQDRLSYDVFVREQALELEGSELPQHLVPINQFYNLANLLAMLGSGTGAQPFKTVADYEAWLRRARQVPPIFDQAITNMREGMAKGIVQPRILMDKVVPQLDQHIVKRAADSTLWGPITAMPAAFADADKQRLTAEYTTLLEDTLVPAYRKLRTFIADEYLPKCRATVGLTALPGGDAWYAYKGWTRTQVLDFMYANSPVEPTRAISEAERFMAIPGQALAYKIGQLKIRELRTRAEQALGPRFDVRAFHTEVPRDGSVPLSILESKIDRWIRERQAG